MYIHQADKSTEQYETNKNFLISTYVETLGKAV